ncbi:hypothetical protein J45TS6_07950 [Paenibacillus sp. J45TS6]|uniref:tetratricopeptide repeat protein n=1 Tax=unclassified Paenibacillus TaxID=185978 RepID=UPI001B01DDA1|nr:hypothetical protein [Paenibacillus sp. J45TS6]GIP42336.1 hypothetical protein J45TS6_07950 [Paenibacillus sp. J45TS6]
MLSSSIVVFPPREPDPLLTKLLSVLCEEYDVYYLSEPKLQEGEQVKNEACLRLAELPSSVLLLTPSELHTVCTEDTLAIVAHPYWLHVAASQTEAQLIMLQFEDEEDASSLFSTCTEQLRAISSLFCSRSEMKCLDATFRGTPALFLDEEQESLNLDLFIHAIHEIVEDVPFSAHEIQWTKRKAHYRAMREQNGPHETFSFLLAVYHYLLGEQEALHYGEEAFLQAVISGHHQSLISHYRFLSAIHAKLGNLQTAASIYGITAFGETEARQYENILSLLAQDQESLARAELLRLNDDYGTAISLIKQLPADHRVRHLLFHMYRETGQLELALSQVHSSDLLAAEDRYLFRLLCGNVEAMRGERHAAIRLFLEAAAEKEEALVHIAALEVLDDKVHNLLKGS